MLVHILLSIHTTYFLQSVFLGCTFVRIYEEISAAVKLQKKGCEMRRLWDTCSQKHVTMCLYYEKIRFKGNLLHKGLYKQNV